jgi:4-hydroxybenzoate polyprenyltransferase
VIYKGKSVQQQWFPAQLDLFKSWHFTATENGWTTDATALEWLEKIFIPQTEPRDHSARLLILDGHGSHETTEFLWKCCEHNIYLLFLPAHTSHVLQPLDLSIFSPLKAAYRKELYKLSSLIDSTPIGKRNFLICYQKARQASITSSNIKAGWKASGLWPVSAAKPLMSRLLLENSNKLIESTSQKTPTSLLEPPKTPLPFYTPKGRRDLHLGLHTLASSSYNQLPTQRLLFRKITKGFDKKDFELGKANMRIKELEARLEQLKPRKRRKVQTSPNSKFTTTRAIWEAQIAAGDREIGPIESESEGDSESTESCIEVDVV